MSETEAVIYQLKVTLEEIRPAIWRRFLVRSDITFRELHETLQVVMGWENYHLHQFVVDNIFITDADTILEWSSWKEEEGSPDDETHLDAYITEKGQKFSYEYDFGDSWLHKLVLEKLLPVEPDGVYPHCLDGARACPPEDVGGIWGYADYLEAMADPEHEEHDSYMEWRGEFDPEAFDAAEVNRQFREGIRWEGDLVMAPLVSSQKFTKPAQLYWDSIPPHYQALLLGEAWCDHCSSETTIVDFTGKIRKGNLVLDGKCVRCGEPVGLIIVEE